MRATERTPGVVAARLIGALALGAATVLVMRPFVTPLLWAAILAFVTWPLYQRLAERARHRELAAGLFALAVTLAFGVPVALSTDDAGIERIDLTHEFARAVESYALSYADLKELVRNSIEYSFLPGSSMWDEKGAYVRFVADCASDVPGGAALSKPCAAFLAASEKAAPTSPRNSPSTRNCHRLWA